MHRHTRLKIQAGTATLLLAAITLMLALVGGAYAASTSGGEVTASKKGTRNHERGRRKKSNAQRAAAIAQSEAERQLKRHYRSFQRFDVYDEDPKLKVLPCTRDGSRKRDPTRIDYLFRCSVIVFEECVFVAPDFSGFYSCEIPKLYRRAEGNNGPWYDEMPSKALRPAGNGYLHPWCTGPGGMQLTIIAQQVGKRKGQKQWRMRSHHPFVYVPDSMKYAPWKCPTGTFEPVETA